MIPARGTVFAVPLFLVYSQAMETLVRQTPDTPPHLQRASKGLLKPNHASYTLRKRILFWLLLWVGNESTDSFSDCTRLPKILLLIFLLFFAYRALGWTLRHFVWTLRLFAWTLRLFVWTLRIFGWTLSSGGWVLWALDLSDCFTSEECASEQGSREINCFNHNFRQNKI